jgi:hypothetical protein
MTNPTINENSKMFPIVFPFQGCDSVYSVYTDEGAGRFHLFFAAYPTHSSSVIIGRSNHSGGKYGYF